MPCKSAKLNMEDLYAEYFPVVYNYVFYKLLNKENTEDVVSQIFMKIMANLDRFDSEKASLKTWIFRITDNTLIDYYRKRRITLSYDSEEAGLENVLSVDFEAQYNQILSPMRQAVFAALAHLPERDRTFIYYRYYLGITNREIARRTGMKESTVSAVLARARKKLKDILGDESEE